MILHYAYNIFRFKRWKLLLFVGVCVLLSTIVRNLLSVTQLAELHKCPACYGVSACPNIQRVQLSWRNVNVVIFHLFGVKNVFFGTYDRSDIVLKKLAHSSELIALDVAFCNVLRAKYPCTSIVREKLDGHTVDFYHLIKRTVAVDYSEDHSSRLRLCPTTQRLDDLFHNVHLNNEHIDPIQYLINLWMLITINPEPVILQILPAEDGWPVPKYFGACGRIVMEEYIGPPLTAYYDKSWVQRARIASSLLNAAYMFTFENENFGFYLTDVSANNIAVDHKDIAKFIDLENIIVVDKNISLENRSEGWQELQENAMHLECLDCFAFSPEDICSHRLSDHNYFAICQRNAQLQLLLGMGGETSFPGGFLHGTPIYIRQYYPDLEYLLQQCAIPDSTNSRIISGLRLKALLDAILKELPIYQ